MPVKIIYYNTKEEAEAVKTKGDRINYEANKGCHITPSPKKGLWEQVIGK